MTAANKPRKPELLAPAGDDQAMKAAVANGADAVYFGLTSYSARARATNFPPAELPNVMKFLRTNNVRGYVTFNTLVFSDELDAAGELARTIAHSGASAAIVQDLGLAALIHRMCPTLEIHASTQMTQTEALGVGFLKRMGVKRVILARELSVAEISAIATATDEELEVFIHGAICISFSGQCQASQSLWARSGNRGQCGQACRLPYRLVVDGELRDTGARQYPLSPQDLAGYDYIHDLAAAGVAGLKIEGRLKNVFYVAAVVRAYREAINASAAGEKMVLGRQAAQELSLNFSRGLSHGFLGGAHHQRLVEGLSPKNRGLAIGTVTGVSRKGLLVELDGACAIAPGDGVVFGIAAGEADELGGRVYSVLPWGQIRPKQFSERPARPGQGQPPQKPAASEMAVSSGKVELQFANDFNFTRVAVGTTVFKTDDPQLRKQLEATFARQHVVKTVPLAVTVTAVEGRPLELTFRDGDLESSVAGDTPLEKAQKHPLTMELLYEQLSRLGETPYHLGLVELVGADGPCEETGVMVPKSVLNNLRRDGIAKLLALRDAAGRHEIAQPQALEEMRREIAAKYAIRRAPVRAEEEPPHGGTTNSAPAAQFSFLCRAIDQIEAIAQIAAEDSALAPARVYLDLDELADYSHAVELALNAGFVPAVATPRIIKGDEMHLLQKLGELAAQCGCDVLVRNLGSLEFFSQRFPSLKLIGDASLNITNELSAAVLADAGLKLLTPAYEIDSVDLSAMLGRIDGGLFETVIYQHVPMFHTAHCLFAAGLSTGQTCRDCGRPCRRHKLALRDRNSADHPVVADMAGRNTVFNSRVQQMDNWKNLLPLGVTHFRLELLNETPAEIRKLMGHCAKS